MVGEIKNSARAKNPIIALATFKRRWYLSNMDETDLKKWADEFKSEYYETNWGASSPLIDRLLARIEELEIELRELENLLRPIE